MWSVVLATKPSTVEHAAHSLELADRSLSNNIREDWRIISGAKTASVGHPTKAVGPS